jgi:small subunit ribosomal protein S17
MARKKMQGVVVKTKMEGTVVVEVETKISHPIYKKVISRRKNYLVDVAGRDVEVGDKVEILEVRPISKNKRWKIVDLINN